MPIQDTFDRLSQTVVVIGTRTYYYDSDDLLHRENGPALTDTADDYEEWHWHGELHRDGGPAFSWSYGEDWCQHGGLHRDGGPAVITNNGRYEWWVNDRRHRIDGPAQIFPDMPPRYWWNGRQISKEAHEIYVKEFLDEEMSAQCTG